VKLAAGFAVALAAVSTAAAAYKPSPLLPLDGAYRMGDGRIVSLAVTPDGLLYTDTSTGDLRQLQAAGAGRFRFGPAYLVQRPLRGTIVVRGAKLTLATGGRTSTGTKVRVTRRRVSFQGQGGVRIVGKVTSPATPANLDNLAGDAAGALRVLGARRDVDPARVGLVGGSQAGWIIPRAAAKSPLVRFAVITSGAAVSVGEQEAYAGMIAQGALAPPPTDAEIRSGLEGVAPSGFDPRPDLQKLSIPTLWLYGREDKTIYAPQSVEVLESLPSKPTVKVFPAAGHFVLDTPHGLSDELPRAHRFAAGFFGTIAGWLASLPAS